MHTDAMNITRWWAYVERVIGDDNAQEAARKAGFDASAFTRWKNGSRPDALFALKFARAYRQNVLEALVEGEFITEAEAGLREVPTGVADISTADLAVELASRLTRD